MLCNDRNSEHDTYLYIFNDNNGCFHLRYAFYEIGKQHDKAEVIKTAFVNLTFSSDLCNCHALKTIRNDYMNYPDLN